MRNILRRIYNTVYPEPIFPGNGKIVSSYSQTFEDLIVDSILGCKSVGTYVDVGANDPVDLSNTYRFYRKGWTGICIEPNADKVADFVKERPNDLVINAGVSDVPGQATFYVLDHHTVSTFDITTARSTNLERGTKVTHSVIIPLLRLDAILGQHLDNRKIDLMSIDVEGYEIKVLRSNDWKRYRPKVIIIEINHNTTEILDYLYTQGYLSVMRNAENGIFVAHEVCKP